MTKTPLSTYVVYKTIRNYSKIYVAQSLLKSFLSHDDDDDDSGDSNVDSIRQMNNNIDLRNNLKF